MRIRNMLPTVKRAAESDVDHPFYSLQRQMNSLFDDFFTGFDATPRSLAPGGFGAFSPSIDVKESDKDFVIRAELPGVEEKVETGLGSVDEVNAGKFSARHAPLVLANILAPVLIRLFEGGMARLVTPGGVILLAGILAEQGAGVRAAAEAQGLTFVEQRHSGDWVALVMRQP